MGSYAETACQVEHDSPRCAVGTVCLHPSIGQGATAVAAHASVTLVLALNAGSSSLRFAAQDAAGHVHWRGRISGLGTPQARLSWQAGGNGPVTLGALDHRQALDWLLERIVRDQPGDVLLAVGHRVVHGGPHQRQPARIDAALMRELEALVPLAPLHQPHCLHGIRVVRQRCPDLPQFACFDTGFHFTRSALEQRLALPGLPALAGVQSYGFHGLSYEYLASRLPEHLGTAADGRVVLAHLGQGASLCALRGGTSQATTMSFTPLDGLPMGSRCGQLDPSVLLYLQRVHGMGPDCLEDLLNHQAGLLGLSGISADMRELLASDDPRARFAVDYFVHHTVKAIGAMAAVLGGLDALVFSGAIGEGSAEIRGRILAGCAWLGIALDVDANRRGRACISRSGGKPSAWLIATDEEQVIARHSWQCLQQTPPDPVED
jgi:acetate kinase